MKIRGVAFDLEGTIINLEPLHFNAFVSAMEEYDFVTTFETIVTQIPLAIGGGDTVIAEGLRRLYSMDIPIDEILLKKRQYYERDLENTLIVPREGFIDFLLSVQKQGIKTAIGSLTPRASGEYLLERAGLGKYFSSDTRVFLEDVANKKPAPDVYQRTADLMVISASEQIVFEDSVPGVMAATAAGCKVIAMPIFASTNYLAKLSQAGASKIYLNWREVNLK